MIIHTECNKCGAVINTKIKKASNHLVSVKCVFCGSIEEWEIDKENGVEKKLNNYQEIIAKNHKKIKNQAEEITRLQDKLNMANGTVSKCFKSYETIERQLKVQDNELARRLTIIHYLESKLFKGVEND